jgi:hypothetical protein
MEYVVLPRSKAMIKALNVRRSPLVYEAGD